MTDQIIMIDRGQIIIILYKDCMIAPLLQSMYHTNSRNQIVYLPKFNNFSWIDFDLKSCDHGCLGFSDKCKL